MAPPLSINSTFKLLNDTTLPILGFGVWDSPADLTTKSCLRALEVGYRHIDTAQVYGNEAEVGAAIKQSGLPRKDIFVTSKILSPASNSDPQATYEKCLDSVRKIAGEGDDAYVDLMLIHNSTSGKEGIRVMWQAMERCLEEGKFRAIGVSNFGVGHVEGMRGYARVWPPMVDQLELHPWLPQPEIVSYCQKHNIAVEAYCPLVRNAKAEDPTLKSIAKKHNIATSQVLIRFSIQRGWIPLPKSDNPDRIKANADIFGFELDADDMKALDGVKKEAPLVVEVDNKTEG